MLKGGSITDQKPPYYEFVLGLFQSPFSNESDNQFYFPTHAFEQRLAMLRRMVLGKDYIVLVIGEEGSGKTMLLNQYLETTGASWRRCKIKAYDKQTSNRATTLDQLDDRSAYILREGQTPILFMDDAHELSVRELQHLLQNTVSPDSVSGAKRLILFGDATLKTKLESLPASAVSKTPVNSIYIPPLSQEETAEYLQHRLAVAGLKSKNPFSASKAKTIYKASAGLPAQINANAHTMLEKIYARKSWFSGWVQTIKDHKKIGMITAIVGLAIFILVFIAFDGHHMFYSKPTPKKSVHIKKSSVVKRGSTAKKPSRSIKTTAPRTMRPKSAISTPTAAKAQKPTTKPLSQPSKSSQPNLAQQSPPPAPVPTQRVFREKWLEKQPKTSYTVQILGARDEAALMAFIKSAPLPKDAAIAYFETRHKGNQWYSLLCGIYPDKKAALAAASDLPIELKRRSPWVRSLASVQLAIRGAAK